jgi:N6-adenosine-specific RNA methylase IME4
MSLSIPVPQSAAREIVPAGTCLGVCYCIATLGTQEVDFGDEVKRQRQIYFGFELPDELLGDGRPFSVGETYQLSWHASANLRRDIESWRGQPLSEAALRDFDLASLINHVVVLKIQHRTSRSGRDYARIATLAQPPKGVAPQRPINPSIVFSFAAYDVTAFYALPDWLQQAISRSPEHAAATQHVVPIGKRLQQHQHRRLLRRPTISTTYPSDGFRPVMQPPGRKALTQERIPGSEGCSLSVESDRMNQLCNVIYGDPPRTFKTYSHKGKGRSAEAHYNCLRTEEIKKLPVGHLAAPDCLLAMWCTFPHLMHGLVLMEAWGFEYRTVGFCWAKCRKSARGLICPVSDFPFGTGYYTRGNAEICLFGVRGKSIVLHHDVPQLIVAPRRKHSQKPDAVYERLERLLAGPYVEIFARQRRPGWGTAFSREAYRSGALGVE